MSELQCKFKSALTIGPQLLESTARAPQPLQRRLHGGRTCCVRVARRPGKVNYNSWQLLGNADLLFTRKIHHATFTSLLPASDCEGSLPRQLRVHAMPHYVWIKPSNQNYTDSVLCPTGQMISSKYSKLMVA